MRRLLPAFRFLALAAALLAPGCGSSDSTSSEPGTGPATDASTQQDSAADAASDTALPDASPQDGAPADAAPDAVLQDDGGVDAGGEDAARDAAPDVVTDTGIDSSTDPDASADSAVDDGPTGDSHADADGASADDAGDAGGQQAQVCEPNTWLQAVPAAGASMMTSGTKAYLFAQDGKTWVIVDNLSALSQSIPLPAGVTEMKSVVAEMAPSGRPLVAFSSSSQRYAAFFDGQAFVGTTLLGQATAVHADALERIYALTPNGLTEFAPGMPSIVRGALPHSQPGWNVGADGTVYVMYTESRPSTIHPGDMAIDLKLTHLDHGSLTWTGDALITSNEGWGFSNVGFVAASDGSLHVAYALSYEGYYFRSMDGVTWLEETFMDIVSKATLVDPASPVYSDDPVDVKGSIRLLAAQDFEHASITLIYAQGSMSVPGFYFLRRCAPFSGINETWPAERLAFSGLAFDNGAMGVSESGLPSFLTPSGVRQNVHVP